MRRVLFKSFLVTGAVGIILYFYSNFPNVQFLKKRNPQTTALMELRDQEYRDKKIRVPRQQIWIPYERISDSLKKAVLLSEDAAFFSHKGIDLNELKEAVKTDWETLSFKRGGSTITMQVAKNLYLTPSKNPLRKLKEIVIAWQLEQQLPKTRIFEIYLNVVEWGRNIYGAEAASRHYFGKSAGELDYIEAATLAALLPSPRNSREKSLTYRRNVILDRMARAGYITQAEHLRGKQTPLFKNAEDWVPASMQLQ